MQRHVRLSLVGRVMSTAGATIIGLFLAALGLPASAGDPNSGWKAAVAALQANAAAQAAQITSLQKAVAALQSENSSLQKHVTALQAQVIPGLSSVLLYDKWSKTVKFRDANVQIVNGAGSTATANGLGNLILGYNEASGSGPFGFSPIDFCSLGSTVLGAILDTQAACEQAGYTWASLQRTGSHNLVIGALHGYTQYGGLILGFGNVTNAPYASVSGGLTNAASGYASSVSGGNRNTASGGASSISGGGSNMASGYFSSVSGGSSNMASEYYSIVSGGNRNMASGPFSSVSGGGGNAAISRGTSVSGGLGNIASKFGASVSGGAYVTSTVDYGWAAGGIYSSASTGPGAFHYP